MHNDHFIHQRRAAMRTAIEFVRSAGKEGITSTALADDMLISCTTAKSYLRTMTLAKIVKSSNLKTPKGFRANFYVMKADQLQIDAFISSDLMSKKANPPKRRGITIKPQAEAPGKFPTTQLASGRMARVYADLPLDFFRPTAI